MALHIMLSSLMEGEEMLMRLMMSATCWKPMLVRYGLMQVYFKSNHVIPGGKYFEQNTDSS